MSFNRPIIGVTFPVQSGWSSQGLKVDLTSSLVMGANLSLKNVNADLKRFGRTPCVREGSTWLSK